VVAIENTGEETALATQQSEIDIQASLNAGLTALQRLVDAITDGALVAMQRQNGQVHYDIKGGNLGLLIGKRGQTLDALQYLVDKIVNRNNAARVQIQVDVEGYLAKRCENLREMAVRMATKAKRSGKPLTLEQMSPYDRRIIHEALKDNRDVRTQSIGEGALRKLIISPRRAGARSPSPRN
jgi:spoIIIJ-associated protein